jgi:hypothetical protein
MSSKIPLYFLAEQSADGIPSIRLMAWVSFKSIEGHLYPMKAIIDTGAPVSLIPFRVWGRSMVTMGKPAAIPSISERPECDLKVTHGRITISLLDDNWNEIVKDWTIQADLCHTSEMPIILGMHGFLSQGCLMMNYPANEAWLEL